jgi:hypothetical protein
MKAIVAEPSPNMSRIVDFEASKHMTPYPILLKTYKFMFEKDKVQIVDDSLCPITEVGNITCTLLILFSFTYF